MDTVASFKVWEVIPQKRVFLGPRQVGGAFSHGKKRGAIPMKSNEATVSINTQGPT